MVEISSGANSGSFDFAGKTVAEVRRLLTPVYNIPSEAAATVNGDRVDDEATATLEAHDELEFTKTTAEKGA